MKQYPDSWRTAAGGPPGSDVTSADHERQKDEVMRLAAENKKKRAPPDQGGPMVRSSRNSRLERALQMGKRSKYGAMPTRIDGHRFDSKKEGIRYVLLKDMANKGEIEELELQPRFAIEINGRKICTYVADFQYRLDGEVVVEDVKGVRTPVYRLKKKMVEAVYDFEITEI